MKTWCNNPGRADRAWRPRPSLPAPKEIRIPIAFARKPGTIAVKIRVVPSAPWSGGPSPGERWSSSFSLPRGGTLKRELQRARQGKSALRKIEIHFRLRLVHHRVVRWLGLFLGGWALVTFAAEAQPASLAPAPAAVSNSLSQIIEAAGHVEFTAGSGTNWQPASVGLALKPGDRVRTRQQSRAAVQLSDRSVIRLSERTTLEILPPRRAEKKRFGLPRGSLFFFNRDKPADVEFDTPLAAGAIRGTEFLLEVAEADNALHLALMDGLVALNTGEGEIALGRGQELSLKPGQPPQKTALVNATATIQWALYYPAVLNPDELSLSAEEREPLRNVLVRYRAGDLLAALASWPDGFDGTTSGARALHAQLELAVGRVTEAERLLSDLPAEAPTVVALRGLISVVRGEGLERRAPSRQVGKTEPRRDGARRSASEWLVYSYTLQAQTDLPAALSAGRQAAELAPESGFAHVRRAELEFAFGNRRAALAALDRAMALSPRLAPAHALQGFVLLEQGDVRGAEDSFDRARQLDAALGPAWLGRGLCELRQRKFTAARSSFQAAAALEPQRGLFRAYLGKAASELDDAKAAEKEFNLAKRLDPNDPTAWLYSALHLWQENRLNEAIRDLERSGDLNDQRAVFRSQLLLDQDRSVRSANLAALYDDAGIPDASRHAAARAVAENYANFSGHLFLANSYQAVEDVNRYNLRLESARQSELLVANLLAPPGAGNLSQQLSQQEHLRFFDPQPVGVSSLSEYASRGDWRQAGTVFGTLNGFSYAFDSAYESLNGQQPNGDAERRQFTLTLKQRITADDDAYFQAGHYEAEAGDVASYYDPAQAKVGFRVSEKQEPTLYAGWHHAWSPGSHTLLLVARLDDRLTLHDPDKSILFLQTDLFGNNILAVQQAPLPPPPTGQGPVAMDFLSDFTLYSVELQQIWETSRHTLVVGGRWQSGDLATHAAMSDFFLTAPMIVIDESVPGSLDRGNVYAYGSWQVLDPLRLIAGVNYDHVTFPKNLDLPPLSMGETSRELVSPKAGLVFQPWERGLLRGSYTKSLGGLYFDNSVRLEPTQVGGFNTAFRSLIPESVAGLVPGTEFETAGVGFDQSLPGGTWFGIEAEQLTSRGEREAGAFKFFTELLTQATANSTRQTLDLRERSLSAYAGQLLGDNFSVGTRYRVGEAELTERFPDIPDTALGLSQLEGDERATLHQLSLMANFHHRSGVFAQWESAWYRQSNSALAGADFWQHNLVAGYRFPRRHAEIRVGLLNLFDTDYRLNPLNLHADLPRGRTFVASLRLNF